MISFRWLISLSVIVLLVVVFQVSGGVDVHVYKESVDRVLEGGAAYYYKEIVSWGIIAFNFKLFEGGAVYALASLTLLMWIIVGLFVKGVKTNIYISLMLVSPFGVLLSLNVLRQYVAVLFFFVAFISLLDKKSYLAHVMAILTVLSHNSFIVFIVVLYSLYYLGPKLSLIVVILFSFCISLVISSGPINSVGDERVKLILHIMYVLGIYAFIPIVSYCCRWIDLEFGVKLFGLSLLSIAILFSFGAEIWQINRLLISLGFFLLLYITHMMFIRPHKYGIRLLIVLLLIFYNSFSLMHHSGAMAMINKSL